MTAQNSARRRRERLGVFDIRVGDQWGYISNNGNITRTITDVDDERIYYRPYGSPYEQSCLRSTFRRWWKGAVLEFATDWEGREVSGRTPFPHEGEKQ